MANESLEKVRQDAYEKAKNPDTPIKELMALSRHEDKEVRAILALNTHEPKILEILSHDPAWEVREEVSMNRSTPASILDTLRSDENEYVRAHLTTQA